MVPKFGNACPNGFSQRLDALLNGIVVLVVHFLFFETDVTFSKLATRCELLAHYSGAVSKS